ncbi:aquaporin-like protein [Rhizodiscina lignyota]|uniref:Aquaporin-like protein n=1 Tax=Rhizodiscina lignyota TaxID=1504668 RepID=A0A9P4MBE0_9PEZI|nr:aquaporin-like protein [Rhizodiscina lignyota]
MMAIYIAGGVSGAHCNPMISIVLSVFRGFPARKVIIYICAQILGAICAVWIAYGIYKDAIMNYDPGKTSTPTGTGTAFFTLPQPFATPATAFMTDFTSAAIMCGTVLAMGDDTNSPPGAGMHAFIIGLVGFAMASTLGYNTGPQTNPAKDLATRFVPNVVGYGSNMWEQGWWAEAWTAAVVGGLVGCLIYDVAIFEGPESPVNYPMLKRKKARQGTKAKWHLTGMFGSDKKKRAKADLEAGHIGIMERAEERRLDGHGEK